MVSPGMDNAIFACVRDHRPGIKFARCRAGLHISLQYFVEGSRGTLKHEGLTATLNWDAESVIQSSPMIVR